MTENQAEFSVIVINTLVYQNYDHKLHTPEKKLGHFNRVRTLFQKQFSRTFPELFQDSNTFFQDFKMHNN